LKSKVGVLGVGLALVLCAAAGQAVAEEVLHYDVKMRSALTLFSWSDMGDGKITTREAACPSDAAGACRETSVYMTSVHSKLLESTYPLRYLYRTAYRLDDRVTLAFEELRRRREKEGLEGYQWRHRVIWLADLVDGKGQRYDFDETGEPVPPPVLDWITKDKAEGYILKAKTHREVPTQGPALDRWATMQLIRTLDLAEGKRIELAGQGTKGTLAFTVSVERPEKVELAGRSWQTWKVRIDEQDLRPKGEDSTLVVWVTDDEARTPVKFEMDHDIGLLRFELVAP